MTMSSISHHPNNELITAYSAGNLPLSQSLCIATHMEYCDICRQSVKQLDVLGSELMQTTNTSPISPDLKSQVMARLDGLTDTDAKDASIADSAIANASIPDCLRHLVNGDYQSLDWKRLSPDICSVELCRDNHSSNNNGSKVELLKISPGGSAATHTHTGNEYTVILKGSFSDEQGFYSEGDFLMRSQSDHHTPMATKNSECICLAVTEGPIRLTGIFGRLINPLLRYRFA